MLSGHRGLDYGLLHRPSVGINRRRAEILETEPPLELSGGVVMFPAPAALRVSARRVPEPSHEAAGFRELVAHPGRHHRIASRHRQPGKRVGQRPAGSHCVRHGLAPVRRAGYVRKPLLDCCESLGFRWAIRSADFGEELVQGLITALVFRRCEPMPGRQQVRCGFLQRKPLVLEDFQREAGVELRIVQASPLEAGVLVVLDKVVVRIAWEGEGAETKRVDDRETQKPQIGLGCLEVGQIELDQVVPEDEGCRIGETVEPGQGSRQISTVEHDTPAGIRAHPGEGVNSAIFFADFEV